jgi:hypothetical protein
MQDDIYALGVCLLEIGLWQSFVICDKEDGIPQSGNGIDLSGALTIKEETKRALRIKELFIAAAQEITHHGWTEVQQRGCLLS